MDLAKVYVQAQPEGLGKAHSGPNKEQMKRGNPCHPILSSNYDYDYDYDPHAFNGPLESNPTYTSMTWPEPDSPQPTPTLPVDSALASASPKREID